jgi:EAL domain-containing protein (putative c-di-GMP-specific phosphodiesterase class I)
VFSGQIPPVAVVAHRSGSMDGRSALLSPDGLRPVFQPVVNLDTGAVVGYEALARTRADLPALAPQEMFAWGRRAGQLSALDWSCRCAAFRGAVEAGIRPPLTVLVNAEPAALDSGAPAALWHDVQLARRGLRVVIELTERQLAHAPVRLFRVVDSMRALGWGIALDDVGAEPTSLALLPLLQPDVIKLDRSVLLDPIEAGHAATLHAAAAEAERTGAVIVAEGIETWRQAALARSLGAHYGQGFLWGRPTPTPRIDRSRVTRGLPQLARTVGRPEPHAATHRAQIHGVAELRTHIELMCAMAENTGSGVLLTSWPDAVVADQWHARLARAANHCAFVGSTAGGPSTTPPHQAGYEIVVLGPHAAATLTAEPTETPQSWIVSTTYQRNTAILAGQRIIRRASTVPASLGLPGQRRVDDHRK